MRQFSRIVSLFCFFSFLFFNANTQVQAVSKDEKIDSSIEWIKRLEGIRIFFEKLPLWSYIIFFILVFVFTLYIFKKKKSKIPVRFNKNDEKTIIPGNAQHIGSRTEQQDAFCFSDVNDDELLKEYGVLAVLADGMGGLTGGKEASDLAVQTFLDTYMYATSSKEILEKLLFASNKANTEVYEYSIRNGLEGDIGTTLVAAVVHNYQLYWLSIGDSRIYLLQNGSLKQLTTDHVYAKELDEKVNVGEISREDALNHPERNSLTSYIGLEEIPEIDYSVTSIPLYSGDRIILCSDGLYGSITENEMLIACSLNTQECADKLVEHALVKGKPHQDNITVTLLTIT